MKRLRSERVLMLVLAGKGVQGESTRKVARITERLRGSEIVIIQISHAASLLDKIL